jgi:hypothetical protein
MVLNSAKTPASRPQVTHNLQRAWRFPALEERHQFGSILKQA